MATTSPAIALQPLMLEERVKTHASHRAVIDFSDFTDTAGTSKVLILSPYVARDRITNVFIDVVKVFLGGSISAVTAKVGYDNASLTDVDDAFVLAKSVFTSGVVADAGSIAAVDASTVDNTYGQQENDVISSLRTKLNQVLLKNFTAQEGGNIILTLTSTTANLSALTQGKMFVYFNLFSPSDSALRPLSAP